MNDVYPPAPAKGALKSKGVWGAGLGVIGALIPFLGALGWLPFDIAFDADTGDLSINIYSVAGAIAVGATGVGGPLALIGRLVGKSAIRGLW